MTLHRGGVSSRTMLLKVREVREAQEPHLSQEKLAQRAGIALKTVRRAEKLGRASSDTLVKLAEALGVKPGALFEDEEQAS